MPRTNRTSASPDAERLLEALQELMDVVENIAQSSSEEEWRELEETYARIQREFFDPHG